MKTYKKIIANFLIPLFTLIVFGTNVAFATTGVDTYVVVNPNCPYYTKHHGNFAGFGQVKSLNFSGFKSVSVYRCDCGAEIICSGSPSPHTANGEIGYYTSSYTIKSGIGTPLGFNYYFECGAMSYSNGRSTGTWEFYR